MGRDMNKILKNFSNVWKNEKLLRGSVQLMNDLSLSTIHPQGVWRKRQILKDKSTCTSDLEFQDNQILQNGKRRSRSQSVKNKSKKSEKYKTSGDHKKSRKKGFAADENLDPNFRGKLEDSGQKIFEELGIVNIKREKERREKLYKSLEVWENLPFYFVGKSPNRKKLISQKRKETWTMTEKNLNTEKDLGYGLSIKKGEILDFF